METKEKLKTGVVFSQLSDKDTEHLTMVIDLEEEFLHIKDKRVHLIESGSGQAYITCMLGGNGYVYRSMQGIMIGEEYTPDFDIVVEED